MLRTRGHFIEGHGGRLFLTEHRPAGDAPLSGVVLVVPAFAEEMNKSRRMYTLLAARLAADGIATVVLDFHGSGDSEGGFVDARWDTWGLDVRSARDWIAAHHPDVGLTLLGHRLGALLALQAAVEAAFDRLLLWQPVLNGKQFMTQFLRLRLAGAMADADADGNETTQSLRARFAAGETVEVAGYEIAAQLGLAIDAASSETIDTGALPVIDWFELAARPDAVLPAPKRKFLDALEAAGVEARLTTVVGAPFWSLQEIEDVDDLIEATASAVHA